jgi:hypothetical protein
MSGEYSRGAWPEICAVACGLWSISRSAKIFFDANIRYSKATTVEDAMRQGIAFAVFAGVALIGTAAEAACAPQPTPSNQTKPHAKPPKPAENCFNLNDLPQISQHVIAAEPGLAPVKPSSPDTSTPASSPPPTRNSIDLGGLAVGLTKPDPGVRPTPTVGYHWSLD